MSLVKFILKYFIIFHASVNKVVGFFFVRFKKFEYV